MRDIDWTPTIGDPSLMGWLTVVAYFAAATLCLQAFKTEKRGPDRPYRQSIPAVFRVLRKQWRNPPVPARRAAMWLALASLLVCLGINKQLDLQTLLTEIGRSIAYDGGWYEERHAVQALFVAIVSFLGVISLAIGLYITRGPLRDFRLPLAGIAFIVSFVVVRAASFHHVDELIRSETVGIRLNWLLELGGIAMVATGAMLRSKAARASSGRVVQL